MPSLPDRPNLDQLRHQAKDLLRMARDGDAAATGRIHAVSGRPTLATAQLALAREYGFPSWAALKLQVEARTRDLEELVAAFREASIRGRGALRMLHETPEIATYNFATALLLGNVDRVRAELERDPSAATRSDPATGWQPLHAVSASRWHRIDPSRAENLVAVATLLLDAGADPRVRAGGRNGDWSALRCAVAGDANPGITKLLLERGAVPNDHDVYLACFGGDDHESLRLIMEHADDLHESTALSAPISTGDTEAVRILLDAGVDARTLLPGDLFGANIPVEPLVPPVAAAVESDCPPELIALLLERGAAPDTPGQDGVPPYRKAMRRGRTEYLALLANHGASTDVTDVDRFLYACRRGDHTAMERILREMPDLPSRLEQTDHVALVEAAADGRTESVRLMLDAGFPIEARGENGGTALHHSAFAGSTSTVQLLIRRGADMESRDTHWNSTPVDWAAVGSGLHPDQAPDPDWVATVRTLIHAGASTAELVLDPHGSKPPSDKVAGLLRENGIRELPAQ
jgi:ankyrin repeat protein